MNFKTLFYGSIVFALLASVGSGREVAQDVNLKNQSNRERTQLTREGIDAERDSRVALQWAKTCQPVLSSTTLQPYVIQLNDPVRDSATGQVLSGFNGYICNSLSYVARVSNGYVDQVFQVSSDKQAEYMEIFSKRPNAIVIKQD